MTLQEIADNNSTVALRELALDRALATETQTRLIKLGCLDPPADGDFGPLSTMALREYARNVAKPIGETVGADLAKSLLDNTQDTFLPLTLGSDFASRIIRYMQRKEFWFATLSGFLNIVYVEGANEDGSVNADEFNKFNDRRIVIAIEDGTPKTLLNVLATTEPGRFYTENPLNPEGAARIAFGQYKSWRVGTHKAGTPTAHEALVQVGQLAVHRDLNKDGARTGDSIDVGSGFAINQHSGHNADANNIGRASAGCLVGRSDAEHKDFMRLVKTDPRFRANSGYRYISTIIAGDDLKAQIG